MTHPPRTRLPFWALWCLVFLGGCTGAVDRVPPQEARERTQRGLEYIGIYDYSAALAELRPAPASLEPGTADWTRAAFGLASALRYVQPASEANLQESRGLFERVIAEGTDPQLQALARLELAREQETANYLNEPVDIEGARAAYRQIQADYDGQVFGEEAAIRLANTYFVDTENPEGYAQGIAILKDYLEAHPDAELAVVMWQQLAEIEETLREDPAQALEYYEEARKRGFAVPTKKDNFLWNMAMLAEATDQHREAAELYRLILIETPRANEGTVSRQRLEELAAAHPEWNLEIPERVMIQREGTPSAEATPAPAAGTPANEQEPAP